jgi:hypothetical protein
MPLTPGTRLGPYEIVVPLGAGGMGEVYRAKDTRLGRDVAVKVLPQHLSADAEVRARFEREAKTVSSLNHPHICTLFDVGREGDTDYLVMELVEGETLAQRLTKGALPAADVLKLGAQIADALDRAHRAGVIHRDLKPGNVMLTKSGAKLLDFGLARQTPVPSGPGATAGALSQSPTVARPLTSEGMLLGTFQYMAPEQLEGREADQRTDLWALGCVLYEMATGKPAFGGSSPASLIASILKDEPPAMPARDPAVASVAWRHPLEPVVRACLAKQPDERWQSARDLVHALRWLAAGPSGGERPAAAVVADATTYRQLTFRRGSITNARFAPDGRTVLYDAAWEGAPRRVYLTRTESPETTELALPSAALLDVSTTGELALSLARRYLGSWWLGTGMLAQAPLFGGSPREIASGVWEAAWCSDRMELAVIRRSGLESVIEFPLGHPVFASPSWLVGLRCSPDGRHVAFFVNSSGLRGRQLMIVDRQGGKRVFAEAESWHGGLAWRADGRELCFVHSRAADGATLYAVDLEGNKRVLTKFMSGYVTLHDVSSSGDVLLSRSTMTYSIAFRRPGQATDTNLGWFDFSLGKDLSEDGRTLLFDEQGVAHGGEKHTYVRGTDGSAPVRLGPGYARDLSPDARWALNVHQGQLRVLPRGAGTPLVVDVAPLLAQQFATWHPDGERIVFLGAEPGHGVRLFLVPARGGIPRPVTPEDVGFPAGTVSKPVSPDGKRVFAISRENELRVYDLESGAEGGAYRLDEDEEPIRWSGDGCSIFVWRRGEVPIRISRLDLETGHRTPWKEFAPADPTGVVCSRTALLTPDGETCAYTYSHMISELFLARGLV